METEDSEYRRTTFGTKPVPLICPPSHERLSLASREGELIPVAFEERGNAALSSAAGRHSRGSGGESVQVVGVGSGGNGNCL